jgi:osmotically-inducible protein OsmY
MRKYNKFYFLSAIFSFIQFFSSAVFADDNPLTISVRSRALTYDASLVHNIDITTNNGIVSLAGTLPTHEQANLLVEITQATPGVKDVNVSALKTSDGQSLKDDNVITAKVKGTFSQKQVLGNYNVLTSNGVVTVTGNAKNKAQAENATATAHKVVGVKAVNAKINYIDMTK